MSPIRRPPPQQWKDWKRPRSGICRCWLQLTSTGEDKYGITLFEETP